MIDRLLNLVQFHTTHFEQWETYATYSTVYGWLATASSLIAMLMVIFVLFRREAGKATAVAIAQYFLVWGIPLYAPTLLSLVGTIE